MSEQVDKLQAQGYPAYAGIDLSGRSGLHTSCRLPRIRGDRPVTKETEVSNNVATPHTRGSTLLGSVNLEALKGYPAYAGIDPRKMSPFVYQVRLPRIRGDRP